MMNSTSFGKKIAAAALAALTMGSAVTMSAGSAEARDGRKGALIAAGVLGALAVGAIAAQANESRHGYYVDDGYAADDVYAPAYRQPRTVYQQPVQYYAATSRIRLWLLPPASPASPGLFGNGLCLSRPGLQAEEAAGVGWLWLARAARPGLPLTDDFGF